jgi:hypothetical protein
MEATVLTPLWANLTLTILLALFKLVKYFIRWLGLVKKSDCSARLCCCLNSSCLVKNHKKKENMEDEVSDNEQPL